MAATRADEATPGGGPTPRTERRQQQRRRRRRRILSWTAGGLGALALVIVGLPVLLGLLRADALDATTVLGVEVGGLDGEELTAAVEAIAEDRRGDPVTVERGLVDGRDSGEAREIEATAGEAGYDLDVGLTVDAIRRRGRQANPFVALGDHWRSLASGLVVVPVDGIDADALEAWSEEAAEELGTAPIEGEVVIDAEGVQRTDPEPGIVVDAEALAADARRVALAPGGGTVEAELEAEEPETTLAAVDETAALAEAAIADEVRLERGEGAIELSVAELAEVMSVERDGGEFTLTASADALDALVDASRREAVERDPVDADISLSGGAIVIDESADGFRFDAERAAEQLLAIARGDEERTTTLDAEVVPPDRSTADAEDLGITEQVSSFTTEFVPGQSRVTNIQRMADLVDGAVVEPGEEFSLNGHVGPRTEEKGFVGGGAILRGEFVEQIGGGVSQFATTFYNAAYFGGYEILEHQPHSYYISRYPAGRESTINYDTIDVRIRNDSPYGLLIDTSHTDSSVTVSMWGTDWVEVDSVSGPRRNVDTVTDESVWEVSMSRP
ncbi:MAG: VanW family protein [Egibacteraceae bacterium]